MSQGVAVGWDDFQKAAAERLERAGPNTMAAHFSGPTPKENLQPQRAA